MKPVSVTDMRVNLLGLAVMLATTAALVWWKAPPETAMATLMAVTAAPILLLDLFVRRVHLRPSTGLDFTRARRPDAARIGRKWLGGAAMVGGVLAVYFLAPEYQGTFYSQYYSFLWWAGPPALLAGLVYFAWIDQYLVEPKDAYWHVGALLTGAHAEVDREKVADLARTWVIKGFFVPLMFIYACRNITDLGSSVAADKWWFTYGFDIAWNLSFLVDVVFTTMGYLVTLRVFDTQVRSAEPTAGGWVVALICYQPFFSVINNQYLKYEGGYYWGEFLDPYPTVKIVWGTAIALLVALFALCTVAFGCRFSNLTYRGIVTNGPYAWMRHPAYFAKCSSYWLIFVPYVYHGSWYEVLRDCVWLTALCGVYWLRARTEERHLSKDPDYVRYALYMNDHSVFAWVGRLLPMFKYRAP